MTDATTRLHALARSGRISRREVLNSGLRLGLASPVIMGLMAAVPETTRAAAPAPALPRPAQESSGTFTALLSAGAEDIDPHYSYLDVSAMIALGAYEMLLQFKGDSTDEYSPMLADSWEANEDLSAYTFFLPEGVLFHDGSTCDAQAVKDSYTRFLLMDAGPVNVLSRFVQDPEQMEVVDATTLRFNLGRPQPLFLSAMASQYGPSVVSPTAIQENATEDDPYAHEFFLTNAVGTGPYRLVENILSERLVLEKFEEYHRGWEGNHFDRIVFRVVPEEATRRQLLEQGEADGITYNYLSVDNVKAMEDNPDLSVNYFGSTAVTWVIMNAPRLQSPEVRQGFCYAFPYQQVIDGVYQGLLTRTGPLADSVLGYDPDMFLYETDLEKAKELILSGGFSEGDTFEMMFDANDQRDTVLGQLFQASLQEIGFNLELTAVDFSTLENVIFGELTAEERPHFIPWGWWPDYNDPWNQLAPNFLESAIGSGGSNAGFWVNERFEEIMAQAEVSESTEELVELMKEAQQILVELDPPVISIGQTERYTVLRSDIQGFIPNPLYLEYYNFYQLSRQAAG